MEYLICWYYRISPVEVHRGEDTVSLATGQAWLKELNSKYPDMHHFLEPLEVQQEAN